MDINKGYTLIGISGCTNSGKTTLAKFLRSTLPDTILLNQDAFFRPDDSKEHVLIPELNHKNWERLESVDWDAMMEQITSILSTKPQTDNPLLIVEGHIIYNYSPLEKMFHKKYFLKMNSREECFHRRCTRVYDPPDIPGYFDKCVWPMYLSNLDDIERNCSNIMYLDGADPIELTCNKVLHDLKSFLNL